MKSLLQFAIKAGAMFMLLLMIQDQVHSQDLTEGTLTFTVKTSSNGGKYAPKHVLSIWIEDANGFVKTSKLRGDRRKQYLYTWNNRSSGNTVDAVTGSTLSSHQSHTITWDGHDRSGNLVPDGTYKVRVEFTDAHAQGPLYTLSFTKGPEAVSLTPANEGKFSNISLAWEPTVPAAPDAAFAYTVDELTVTFTNGSRDADSFTWDFGDQQTSTESDPVHTYTEAGTYTVTLEATGPGGSATAENEVTVTAAPEVIAAFTYTLDELTVSFSNSSQNADSYTWDFGDQQTSTEADPVHTYADSGTYTVVLEATAGSTSATSQQVITVTASTSGIEHPETTATIFPNPADGHIVIDFGRSQSYSGYKIYNTAGTLLRQAAIDGSGSLSIRVDELEKGSYLLKLRGPDREYTFQFMKR